MTKRKPVDSDLDGTGQGGSGDVVVVREQLVERTCAWCGAPVAYTGKGRPPRYCKPAHRRRASELRTAQMRADRPVSEGGRSTEPVREVVERTILRTVPAPTPAPAPVRPAQRLSGAPYTLPEDAVEWVQALAALRADLDNPKIAPFREYIARACEKTARALREDGSEAPGVDPAWAGVNARPDSGGP
ncbi:hypothetical protein [Streptomyces sp. NPDC090083]|uniref:hypothetical protein n=1 Tax=Streptomyces sp. NPDC090083 TaxID=3365941 RepID=UPI003823BD78